MIPTAAEFKLLESLVAILARIKSACKVWEADKNPTIQTVVPELYSIKDVLKRKIGDRERYVSVFAKELLKLMDQRFPDCGTRNKMNCVAHLLDPEYRGVDIGANNRNSNIEMELDKFLKMKIPSDINLLLFYKEHKTILPILTKVAREIFAIPASSATSERVFSVGSLVS